MSRLGSSKARPQTTLPQAKVMRKFGNWTVETYRGSTGKTQVAVTDGWYVDYPTLYSDGGVGWDNPYRIPKQVKAYVRKIAGEMR